MKGKANDKYIHIHISDGSGKLRSAGITYDADPQTYQKSVYSVFFVLRALCDPGGDDFPGHYRGNAESVGGPGGSFDWHGSSLVRCKSAAGGSVLLCSGVDFGTVSGVELPASRVLFCCMIFLMKHREEFSLDIQLKDFFHWDGGIMRMVRLACHPLLCSSDSR